MEVRISLVWESSGCPGLMDGLVAVILHLSPSLVSTEPQWCQAEERLSRSSRFLSAPASLAAVTLCCFHRINANQRLGGAIRKHNLLVMYGGFGLRCFSCCLVESVKEKVQDGATPHSGGKEGQRDSLADGWMMKV